MSLGATYDTGLCPDPPLRVPYSTIPTLRTLRYRLMAIIPGSALPHSPVFDGSGF